MGDVGNLVGLTPQEALDRAVAYMTQEGASVTGRTENSVTFTYHKGPNAIYLIILLLFLLLPGILYWMVASRDTNFTITATSAEGGCRLLIGGEDAAGDGHYYFKKWVRLLPEPDPTLTVADVEPTETSAPNIPDEIRRLAELRDAGIVTNEEFEAKKRELLDRM
jgi:Short C-terminal domain